MGLQNQYTKYLLPLFYMSNTLINETNLFTNVNTDFYQTLQNVYEESFWKLEVVRFQSKISSKHWTEKECPLNIRKIASWIQATSHLHHKIFASKMTRLKALSFVYYFEFAIIKTEPPPNLLFRGITALFTLLIHFLRSTKKLSEKI